MIHGASIVLSLVAVYCGKKPVITKLKITPWDVVGLDYYNSRIAVLLFTLNPSSGPFLSLCIVYAKLFLSINWHVSSTKLQGVFKWLALASAITII
jgi:hypothetical protein